MKSLRIVAWVAWLLSIAGHAFAEGINLYSADTNHIWNRLYSGLIVRTVPDGPVQDDLLDPPFWSGTKHLLAGESNQRTVVLLRAFVEDRAAVNRMSTLQRAVMQRDLLAVFHWLSRRDLIGLTPEQRELLQLLARATRLVALTEAEIRALPDNYAIAAARPGMPTAFNPAQPGQAFLPKDLLADDGGWVILEPTGDDTLAATVHFERFAGRSAFEVRFRHAEGRVVGEKYLQQLADMPRPSVLEKPANAGELLPNSDPKHGPWPNPATPQFPTNSMWALVRRAMLVDARGNLVMSPLVESVQVRVYRSIHRDPAGSQTAFEWEARRRLWFGEGGFHLTEPKDQPYAQFPTDGDPFELARNRRVQSQLNCFQCHFAPGIHSVNTRSRLFEEQLARPPEFRVITSPRVEQMTQIAARKLAGWRLLQWMWNEK